MPSKRRYPEGFNKWFGLKLIHRIASKGEEWVTDTWDKLLRGECTSSPFDKSETAEIRTLLRDRLRAELGEVVDTKMAEHPLRHHMNFVLVGCALKAAKDPDWRVYLETFACALTWLGVEEPLPRTPAVYPRKVKWRLPEDCPSVADDFEDNYASTKGQEEWLSAHFLGQAEAGQVVRMPRARAAKKYKGRLAVASIGLQKKPDKPDGAPDFRVTHDGTFRVGVNNKIRPQDQASAATAKDIRSVVKAVHEVGGDFVGMAADAKDAHRSIPIREEDWGWQACDPTGNDILALNTCGTYGIGSAHYWFARAFAGVLRLFHYCCGWIAPMFLLAFADDTLLLVQEPAHCRVHLAFMWFLDVLEVPMSWRKCRGGRDLSWIGFYIILTSHRLGLSQSRGEWVISWCKRTAAAPTVVIGEFSEGLGRLGFAVSALVHEKPFLAPLYSFQALHADRARVPVPLFVRMILEWIALRVARRKTVPCAERRSPCCVAFRVDAKAEGMQVAVGGWAPKAGIDGRPDPWLSEWFAVELTEQSAPWAFCRGEPFKTIMALELFATVAAVALLGPGAIGGGGLDAQVVLPSVGDNLGATQVVTKGISTRFPLSLVAMELSARLEAMGARLDAQWAPRELNQEADDLSNMKTEAFDPRLRKGTSHADSIPLVIIPHLLKVAQLFHNESVELKRPARHTVGKRFKRMKLKDREPC